MSEIYQLKIYPRAFQDLEQILEYISENLQNKSAALRLLERFENAFENLCRFPKSCPLVQNEAVEKKGLRKSVVDKYLAFYWVNEDLRQVEIVHIACGVTHYMEIL